MRDLALHRYGEIERSLGKVSERPFRRRANIGQFASEARQELPATKIYSFEPHPRTFDKLRQSKTDNLMFQYSLALSDKIGEVTFYEYGSEGDGTQLNSLIPNARVLHDLVTEAAK